METRIYVVDLEVPREDDNQTTCVTRLVEAGTQAQAVRHVTKDAVTCRVASTKDVAALVGAGVKVETA